MQNMSRVKWEKLLHAFLRKENTLPAQATDPKLPSSSENFIYNHI